VLYACWKKKTVSLTIEKQITGDQADMTRTFKFTVKRGNDTVEVGPIGDDGAKTIGDAEKTKITLLFGDTVTITEADGTGYTTSYSATIGTGNNAKTVSSPEDQDTKSAELTLDGDTTIVFTNDKTPVVITGIKYAGVPGALTAVGAAALAIAGGFAYVRRDEAGTGAHARRRGRR
jgi:hypothetical protein